MAESSSTSTSTTQQTAADQQAAAQSMIAGVGGTFDPNNPYLYTDETGFKWQWDVNTQAWLPAQSGQSASTAQVPELEQQVWVGDDDIPAMPAVLPQSSLLQPLGAAMDEDETGGGGAGGKQGQKNSKKKRKAAVPKAPPKTTSVYVSGLPLDTTKEELIAFMAKCGLIRKDPDSGEYKVKLYEDEQGRPKGDALVVYFKRESVDLALQILDESEIRPGKAVRITEAQFEPKQQQPQQEEATKKGGKIVGKKHKQKKKKKARINQEEELSWVEWETRRHVIIKNMFSPEEAVGDDEFYVDLKNDLREEAEKFGEVEIITVFERNPEGVVAIKFVEPEAAVECLEKMNGRFFAKRRLTAEWYDGVTNYKVKESEEDQKRRLDSFGDWLENQSSSSDEEEEEED